MAKKEKSKSDKAADIILDIIIVGVLFGCAWTMFLEHPIMDSINAAKYVPNDGLVEPIKNLKLTERGDRVLRAAMPELQSADDFNQNCPKEADSPSNLGCYAPIEDRIYIYEIDREELQGIRESVLLHETLHAVYRRLNFIDRAALDEEIKKFDEANPELFKKYLESYSEDSRMSELHSIIGQRVYSKDMPEALRKHYEGYIEDIDQAVSYYHKYRDYLESIQSQIQEYSKTIKEMREVLQGKRDTYGAHRDAINADVKLHNQRVHNNTYYTSNAQINAAADKLNARLAELEKERLALNAYVAELNTKIDAMNSLIERNKDLNAVMNSSAEKPEDEVNNTNE